MAIKKKTTRNELRSINARVAVRSRVWKEKNPIYWVFIGFFFGFQCGGLRRDSIGNKKKK